MKDHSTRTSALPQGFELATRNYLGIPRTHRAVQAPAHAAARPADSGRLATVWARHLDEVRAAQRLRYSIFACEMGARLETPANAACPEHDIDMFDDYCEHLLVRDMSTDQVVGTWDPAFHSADLPIMARLEDLPARYRKHFLGAL